MFDERATKRVRRSSIFSSSSDLTPLSPAALKLNLEFEYITPTAATSDLNLVPPSPTSSSIDFPLFSTSTPARLTLRSPSPPPETADNWDEIAHTRKRPKSYYFTEPSEEQRTRYAAVVVDLPVPPEQPKHRRKQPGKKQRIKMRKQVAAEREMKEKLLAKLPKPKTAGMTDEEIKAEKNRRNREKKAKKKAREKAKKAGDGGDNGDGDVDEAPTVAEMEVAS